ncbi:hypothetical protein K1T71_000485 [Dendrolimus kikuchii]|uniref:Uncharacterized protein n=1 Tax=Dendrolimus kikuchii TaxID=765133 RepID=A0ACC1DKB7_9NEOP|nr:hypothetical protein K1T71_000485 [Dendrolimus kikuchii]
MPSKDDEVTPPPPPKKKSVFIAYFLWLFGGLFGAHHFYLGRDKQAFVWFTTLGSFKVGWLGDVSRIPRYVRQANEDPREIYTLALKMNRNKKPPFSVNRFCAMLLIGYSWGQLMMSAVPPNEFLGIQRRYLNLLVPLFVALGVWIVGNIGHEKGKLKWPLLAAYIAYPLRYYEYTENMWFYLMVLAAALAFDSFSKEWRKSHKKHGFIKRVAVFGLCACLYLSLWCSYIYFYGTITNSEGEEVPIYEAVYEFFTGSLWSDLCDVYKFAQHHGWYEVWKQVVDLSDPQDEQNAFKVLELSADASQQEITSNWRRLSREYHPDKVKDETLRKAAHERFVEIQKAYEILSNSKHRRNRRNKKDNSEAWVLNDEL